MLRRIQKQQKRGTATAHVGALSADGSESDSDMSSAASQEERSEDGGDDCSESESSSARSLRIPQSLLKAAENPIAPIKPGITEDENSGGEQPLPDGSDDQVTMMKCIVCPGKQLKTQAYKDEHLKSRAHERRMKRFRNFIHDPPPHTSLSPDPSEVVELIDALIGPPPVVPAGTAPLSAHQKRKLKRKRKMAESLDPNHPRPMGKPPKRSPPVQVEANKDSKKASKAKSHRVWKRKLERKAAREAEKNNAVPSTGNDSQPTLLPKSDANKTEQAEQTETIKPSEPPSIDPPAVPQLTLPSAPAAPSAKRHKKQSAIRT